MKHISIKGFEMAYLEAGQGTPLVCIHGSLCDFRVWSPVLWPLSRRHRVVAPSLRHFYPHNWAGAGARFTIDQHVEDVVAFVEGLGAGKVNLIGHSRGGHIAFRVAQRRPDLLQKLILAEPGGELAPSLAPADMPASPIGSSVETAAVKIAAGDIDGGLAIVVDAVEGEGGWERLLEMEKEMARDNARTILVQGADDRQPYTRGDAASIRVPTLLVGGTARPGAFSVVVRSLGEAIPGARVAMIPDTTHSMFVQDPASFAAIVDDFIGGVGRFALH
jgi:pimeloyl-ACP methyl ester carboxylesterase